MAQTSLQRMLGDTEEHLGYLMTTSCLCQYYMVAMTTTNEIVHLYGVHAMPKALCFPQAI